jgi:predicted site-specific integrase-resolvase
MTDSETSLRISVGLMSDADVATMLKVSKNTLRIWRKEGRGPAFIKLKKAVLYRLSDVERWLDTRVVDPVRSTPQQKTADASDLSEDA